MTLQILNLKKLCFIWNSWCCIHCHKFWGTLASIAITHKILLNQYKIHVHIHCTHTHIKYQCNCRILTLHHCYTLTSLNTPYYTNSLHQWTHYCYLCRHVRRIRQGMHKLFLWNAITLKKWNVWKLQLFVKYEIYC